jgi:hypothetical protein
MDERAHDGPPPEDGGPLHPAPGPDAGPQTGSQDAGVPSGPGAEPAGEGEASGERAGAGRGPVRLFGAAIRRKRWRDAWGRVRLDPESRTFHELPERAQRRIEGWRADEEAQRVEYEAERRRDQWRVPLLFFLLAWIPAFALRDFPFWGASVIALWGAACGWLHWRHELGDLRTCALFGLPAIALHLAISGLHGGMSQSGFTAAMSFRVWVIWLFGSAFLARWLDGQRGWRTPY